MEKKVYEKNGEWSGYKITEAKTGWVITNWSQIQGAMDGRQILIPYGAWGYQQGQDLTADHNEWMQVGEAFHGYATDNPEGVKVLHNGYKVR